MAIIILRSYQHLNLTGKGPTAMYIDFINAVEISIGLVLIAILRTTHLSNITNMVLFFPWYVYRGSPHYYTEHYYLTITKPLSLDDYQIGIYDDFGIYCTSKNNIFVCCKFERAYTAKSSSGRFKLDPIKIKGVRYDNIGFNLNPIKSKVSKL